MQEFFTAFQGLSEHLDVCIQKLEFLKNHKALEDAINIQQCRIKLIMAELKTLLNQAAETCTCD